MPTRAAKDGDSGRAGYVSGKVGPAGDSARRAGSTHGDGLRRIERLGGTATLCVKATKVTTPKKHYTGGWTNKTCTAVSATHEGKYDKITPSLLSEAEQEKLKKILAHVNYEETGVGGKPTVQVTAANVQIVNGAGKTESVNGAGNLVIGYDEEPEVQTGSHNLVVGQKLEFTGFGGIVAGRANHLKGAFEFVAGNANTVTGFASSVTGGFANTASGAESWVGAGAKNIASGRESSVSGGKENKAVGAYSSILGGKLHEAKGVEECVPSCP